MIASHMPQMPQGKGAMDSETGHKLDKQDKRTEHDEPIKKGTFMGHQTRHEPAKPVTAKNNQGAEMGNNKSNG